MPDYCETCFREIDLLNPCVHQARSANLDFDFGSAASSGTKTSLRPEHVWLAPVAGIVLDAFLPIWTNVITAILMSLVGGAVVVAYWVTRGLNVRMSMATGFRNLGLYLLPPLAFRAFASEGKSALVQRWAACMVGSVLVQLMFITPGNFTALENAISAETAVDTSGGLVVHCPSTVILPVGGEVVCEVETGILALTIPARIEISPILMQATVKVSLN